jgi:hypothetical protein
MAITDTVQLPAVGEQGEPCASCGAPLAADQRYCLNCGQRRPSPQLEYPGGLGAEADAAAAGAAGDAGEPPATTGGSSGGRDQSPLIAVGAIAVLGLMLLVGVLIGRGDGANTVTTAAPAAQPQTTTADSSEQASTNTGKADKAANEDKGGGKSAKASGGDKVAPPPKDAVVADDTFLEDLNSKSGEDQQKASANLPDTVAIPGDPPKTDNKEPGGGSDSTVIK